MERLSNNTPWSPFVDQSKRAQETRDMMMWFFLFEGSQKSNIPALEEAVKTLIKAVTQKTAGQQKEKNPTHVDWQELDMVFWTIILEATALVLSGDLDKLKVRTNGETVDR